MFIYVMFLPITNTIEASDKSPASLSWIKTIPHVESWIGNIVENVYIFSDGMSSQFYSRFVFYFLTKIRLENNITWYNNERGHEKGPMDDIGGTVKNLVFKR